MYFQLEENCLTMLDSGFLTCFRFVLFLFFQWSCVSLVIITSSSEWGYCWLSSCQVGFPCKMDSPSRTAGECNGTPLQCSCLENPMDGGAWWATVHGVAKSQIRLSDFTFTFPFHALEKEMATHSSVLAWRIPGTGEPGGLPSMGPHRVRHDWNDLAAAAGWLD